ncbi:hypothetical protein P5673_029664 [Acropora cervicornis]|uniref:Uncharacterized protein n=1 Tax=Acropora cervicornis TaxID=6130 RepID=A0AAD9UU73_ACRCE|nr:hypothetical protein P5673_029664 [Acropora cervicornis]
MPAFERWTFDSQSGLVGVAVIIAIPEAECAKEVKHLDLNKDDLLIERALVVSSAYDPHGLTTPFVLPSKQLFQDLTQEELRWQHWLVGLFKLSEFSVECCLKMNPFSIINSSQLHHFANASEIGYGSVSYLHLINEYRDFQ